MRVPAPDRALQNRADAPPLKLDFSAQAPGSRRFVLRDGPQARASRTIGASGGNTVEFHLADTPVRDAAEIVLGDALGRSFVVDAGIDERISLKTVAPVPRSDVLGLFSVALASRNLGLKDEAGVLRIGRLANGSGGLAAPGPVDTYHLNHVTASTLEKILDAAVPSNRVTVVPGADNILLVQGTTEERRLTREAIEAFDVDAMSAMASLFVSLERADAEIVATELEDIFGFETQGPNAGSIRFLPVERLNAIVVLARSEALLDKAYDWIERLDRSQAPDRTRLYVYNLQNRKALDLIEPLQNLLGEGVLQQAEDLETGGLRPALTGEERPETGSYDRARRFLDQDKDDDLRVVVDAGNNALLISTTPDRYGIVRDLIRQLDVVPLQVLIEVTIIEVSLGDDLRYGVQYALRTGGFGEFDDGSAVFSASGTSLPLAPSLPGFAFFLTDNGGPEVILEALASKTDVKVVSSPKLVVLDNQQARLQVGDSVPVIVQQTTNTNGVTQTPAGTTAIVANSVVYRDTGVLLEVTPQVSKGGLVNLEIAQEVSDVSLTTTSTIDSPTISQRRMLTTVTVKDGQTVMLGGLIQERNEKSRSGIPLLKDIPLLGALFSSTNTSSARTELIALMTPAVIASPEDTATVTERVKRKFHALTAFYERH